MSGFNMFRSFLLLACAGPFASASLLQMNYTDINDPDFQLMGYMALPPALAAEDDSAGEFPAVVILPVCFLSWRITFFCV